jgi:hypothetical protein
MSEWDVRARGSAIVRSVGFPLRWWFLDKVRHSNAEESADVKAEKAEIAHRWFSGFQVVGS